MLPLVYYFRNRGIVVLVSRSFDGEITSRVLHKMGFRTIRGSTTRGAMQSLREVITELNNNSYVAFTPDGPKGPSEVAQIGASAAARLGNAPLVAVATASSKHWRLKTWDKFIIPKPFAKVEIRQSKPITPGRKSVEEISADLQSALDEVTYFAEESVKKGISG
ncbi:MAG: lysophospholipid acyltransferase family protein [bacterium]